MSNILREHFTQNIYNNIILESKSINIFGAEGIGKSRFIKDLDSLISQDIKVVSINLKNRRKDYDSFVDEIKKQLNITEAFISFSELLDTFASSNENVLLILDNFEAIYKDNADEKFDFDFFDELNSFKNRDNASLVIISTRNYKHYEFYHEGKPSTSPIDIGVMEISPLMLEEIEKELQDRFELDIDYDKLSNMIIGNDRVYELIAFIDREVKFDKFDKNANLYMNYEKCLKQFKKENNIPILDRFLKWIIRNWGKLLAVIGIKSLISVIKSFGDKKDD